MKHWSLLATTAISAVLSAGSALAVTPEEVWEDWKLLAGKGGGTLTSTAETRTGDTLELSGVVSSQSSPELAMTVEIGTIRLTDLGNGSVSITTPDSYPMTISEPGKDTPAAKLTITSPGAALIATGSTGAVSYDFTYPTITISLTELKDPDGTVVDVKADLVMTDTTGTYVGTPATGDMFGYDYTFNIGNLALTATGNNPPSGESFSGSFSLAGLSTVAKGTVLPPEKMENIVAALKEGFFLDGNGSTGALAFTFDLTDRSGPNSFSGGLEGTSFRLGLDATRVDYGFGLTGGTFAMDSPEAGLPPVDGSFGELAFGLLLPVAKSDTPQPVGLLARLVDISLSDSVWGLVDPGAQLPRDPATLILDLDGTGGWAVDILDPAVQSGEVPMPAMPGTLYALDLTEVLLQIVGGKVTAVGGLTFDNSDLMTFGGIPAPDGKITVTLNGINALIDKLVAVGLLPADQVMGARMGLAMFARPGAGPDELVSEIEFKNKGLFVNGQQLQ